MFDGVPDQFYQLISSRTSSNSSPFPCFDTTSFPLPIPLHHHQSLPPTHKNNEGKEEIISLVSANLENQIDPAWSADEVFALFKIRSSMENCFPDFTWEHVSRKLAEIGIKRSADKCKEKFEEESRSFNTINYCKNYRFLSELEELYHGENTHHNHDDAAAEKIDNQKMEKPREESDKMGQNMMEENISSKNETVGKGDRNPLENTAKVMRKSSKLCNKKRKRILQQEDSSFEMFKGFCEAVVSKMMAQQEEMHQKLLEDMVKRDEEKFAREDAWKKQEMDRINKELEIRAREQAIAGDRQSTIIEFLKKFTSSSSNSDHQNQNPPNNLNPPTSSSLILAQNSTSDSNILKKPTSQTDQKALDLQNPSASENPNSLRLVPTSENPQKSPTINAKEDIGKRWPRDEVLALINLRCNLNGEDVVASTKAPLWERISQGMMEMGYKRSAKRCKEKWENINKYFRKTKDVNKKRSLDSRTCPYFHQLSTLYNQGTLVVASPENHPAPLPENRLSSSQGGSTASDSTVHVVEGEKNMVQAPTFDFEF